MATRIEQQVRKFNRQVAQFTGPRMIRMMNEALRELRDLVVTRYMGGARTGPKRLARNTGKMEQRTVARRAKKVGNDIQGSIAINVPYASTHFREKGQPSETLITPKRKQALTIPLDGIKGADKRPRFPASSTQISGKYVDHESGILYGTLPGGRSQMPLFVLRPSVVVPKRIDVARDIEPEGQKILDRIVQREADKIFSEK
jgi:hypothetical protein